MVCDFMGLGDSQTTGYLRSSGNFLLARLEESCCQIAPGSSLAPPPSETLHFKRNGILMLRQPSPKAPGYSELARTQGIPAGGQWWGMVESEVGRAAPPILRSASALSELFEQRW